MGAISGTLSAHLGQGDHMVVTRAVYGSTRALITTVLARFGITATFVDPTDLPAVEAAITPRTRVHVPGDDLQSDARRRRPRRAGGPGRIGTA